MSQPKQEQQQSTNNLFAHSTDEVKDGSFHKMFDAGIEEFGYLTMLTLIVVGGIVLWNKKIKKLLK